MNYKVNPILAIFLTIILFGGAISIASAQSKSLPFSNITFANPVTIGSNERNVQNNEINKRLQFLWDEYMKMVELMITLITGTLAVSAGFAKFGEKQKIVGRRIYGLGMLILLITLIFAVAWRVCAQLGMEIEVFGQKDKVVSYYASQNISTKLTTSYTYDGSPLGNFFCGAVGPLKFMTAFGFIFGIGFLVKFAFMNLPEQDYVEIRKNEAR